MERCKLNQLIQVEHISFVLVFFEGVLSFFSPCVLPILPIYFGFLSGQEEDGSSRKEKKFLNILFFALGIALSFFLLGLAFTTVGQFFNRNKTLFSRIGGIIIILLGLYQIGFYKSDFLNRERRLPALWSNKEVGPVVALVMGFTFSFAWTPCVGPMLSSVLIMASGAKTALTGRLLVGVYAIGFMIPFLLLGLFTQKIMAFFEKKAHLSSWIPKAGGVLLLIMGISVFTGWLNSVTGYLNDVTLSPSTEVTDTVKEEAEKGEEDQVKEAPPTDKKNEETQKSNSANEKKESESSDEFIAPVFEGKDQNGFTHRLEDYKGKVIFLNFWASWCGPCKMEMPDVQSLYEEYGENKGDVIVLGVTNPKNKQYSNSSDVEEEELKKFIKDGGYTFPTILNASGDIFADYEISAFPTTFIIDREGKLVGYAQGMLTKEIMKNAVEDAINQKNN